MHEVAGSLEIPEAQVIALMAAIIRTRWAVSGCTEEVAEESVRQAIRIYRMAESLTILGIEQRTGAAERLGQTGKLRL